MIFKIGDRVRITPGESKARLDRTSIYEIVSDSIFWPGRWTVRDIMNGEVLSYYSFQEDWLTPADKVTVKIGDLV